MIKKVLILVKSGEIYENIKENEMSNGMLRTFLYVRMSKKFFCMLTCQEKIVC
jgi:hypothetical protein